MPLSCCCSLPLKVFVWEWTKTNQWWWWWWWWFNKDSSLCLSLYINFREWPKRINDDDDVIRIQVSVSLFLSIYISFREWPKRINDDDDVIRTQNGELSISLSLAGIQDGEFYVQISNWRQVSLCQTQKKKLWKILSRNRLLSNASTHGHPISNFSTQDFTEIWMWTRIQDGEL